MSPKTIPPRALRALRAGTLTRLDDLGGRRVGIALGNVAQKAIVDKVSATVETVPANSLMPMLAAGRLDVVIYVSAHG